ncbi:MAG: PAS domain-containing sensor histidine kinase [Pseudorhodoplanes sp.]|jgi:PAS domain S-box-containing protein|nr:PAS domain-containing sensor histidine kinase [Pseudorhodoplanes sp.]
MRENAFPWRLLSEPALAVHATGARPAWLWSTDGRRLLWANPGGALIFGADNCAAASGRHFDADHAVAAQIAAIAGSLPVSGAPRLERLRGFAGRFGHRLTCICARVFCGDEPAILVTAAEPAGPRLSLAERVRRLFDACGEPVAVYSANGELLFVSSDVPAPIAGAPRFPEQAVKLGDGDSEVRYVRLPHAAPATDIPTTADDRHAGPTDLIDLSPIAQAISEAQKAMAVERAAQTEADAAATDEAAASGARPVSADASGDTDGGPSTEHTSTERRHPVRFVWMIDADNRFSIEPGDFLEAIGPKMAAELNRPWVSIAADLALDPDGEVGHAIASRDTWSGIRIQWPVDGSDERIAVELAGLPVYDRDRNFRGYRGFGVCRDLARIGALLAERRQQSVADEASLPPPAVEEAPPAADAAPARPPLSLVPASENVVPFRPLSNDNRSATLNVVEENAFQELATRLSARLKGADQVARGETMPAVNDAEPAPAAPKATDEAAEPRLTRPAQQQEQTTIKQDRPLLDLLPVGVLIYRHEHFFYANRAFLRWSGHDSVQDFAEAGGLDTLFIEPQQNDKDQTLRIAAPGEKIPPVTGHLFSIPWADSTAMMLVTMEGESEAPAQPAAAAVAAVPARDEWKAILDIANDGVVTFDRDGHVLTASAGAERLFGYDSGQLIGLPFTNLFAADSAALARNIVATGAGAEKSRDVTARTRRGETLPLQMSIGQIDADAGHFCAAFQNLSRWKAAERELIAARKQAEAASSAKSDFLAKVSHEIRTPLNAIIGFSDVMMNERFGPIGNERYKEYLKDIHASGTHLVSLVNDLLDLSKIEAGKLDLAFEPVNLNDLTQQTVAMLQPQASRERIIIRTALAPELPPVVADARSVRQIVLNLLSNSIKFTGAGGQVILSTARTDHGEAVLRVRDTGVGMSDKDIATALEPFRQLGTAARSDSHGSGLGLPLTKALVEANSARFSIKSAVNAGTLVEIVFPAVRAAE